MSSYVLYIGNKNYSSWSLRPWLAMKQVGLQFEERKILLRTPESENEIAKVSPSKRIPALQVTIGSNGTSTTFVVWESLAILEYVAEQYPSLWPKDKIARSVARSVALEMHAGFAALREALPMNVRRRLPYKEPSAAVLKDIRRIIEIWEDCRKRFGTSGRFLFGGFTCADAMFAPVVTRFKTYNIPLPPVARAYCDDIWLLPAMQEWILAGELEKEVIVESEL